MRTHNFTKNRIGWLGILCLAVLLICPASALADGKADPILYPKDTGLFDGIGNSNDAAMALDYNSASSTIGVTGYQWGGNTGDDIAVYSYGAGKDPEWEAIWASTGLVEERAMDVAVDSNGNVYVTGYTTDPVNGKDIVVLKYNSSGTLLWDETFNGTGDGDDMGLAIAVGSAGAVYVTGYATQSATGKDYITIRYASNGTFSWAKYFDGLGNAEDSALDIVVDSTGLATVTGSTTDTGGDLDCTTVQYNSSGVFQWSDSYDGPGAVDDWGNALALDSGQSILITGFSDGGASGNDFVTRKFTSAGAITWTKRFNGATNGDDGGYALVVDDSDNVYVTGQGTEDAIEGTDIVTLMYDSAGNLQWNENWSGDGTGTDVGYGVDINDDDEIFVAGKTYRGGGMGTNGIVVKYNNSGTVMNTAEYTGTANSTDEWFDVAAGQDGDVFVAGYSTEAGALEDFLFIYYADCFGCVIEGDWDDICFEENETHPEEHCLGCVTAKDRSDWSELTGTVCDDHEWCNGADTCIAGECHVHAGSPCADDGRWCNGDEFCVEMEQLCAHTGSPCPDDLVFCTGDEKCNEFEDVCYSTGNPCDDDGIFCNGVEDCDEGSKSCLSLGDPCEEDGNFCNGEEYCDFDSDQCLSPGDPCESTETCDEEADTCDEETDDDDDDNTPPGGGGDLPDDDDDDSARTSGSDDEKGGCCG